MATGPVPANQRDRSDLGSSIDETIEENAELFNSFHNGSVASPGFGAVAEALSAGLHNNEVITGARPFYATGARALIKVANNPIGVANRVRWTAAYNSNPINTIDTVHPWDIDIGQMRFTAELGQIMDPTKGPEYDGMFSIMQAAIHQPLVEIQVIDRASGTQPLFARGVFTEVNAGISVGELGQWQVRFIGTVYQHYVNQKFVPYNTVEATAGAIVDFLSTII